jgi:hypothetical protein
MMALLAFVPLRVGIAVGVAMAVVAALAWLRTDAAHDARQAVAVEAAQHEQERRHGAENAARAAERDGAADRLRAGHF